MEGGGCTSACCKDDLQSKGLKSGGGGHVGPARVKEGLAEERAVGVSAVTGVVVAAVMLSVVGWQWHSRPRYGEGKEGKEGPVGVMTVSGSR